jgi:hypothetical protein
VATFGSSLGFAFLWANFGRAHALVATAVALAVAIPVAALLLRGVERPLAAPVVIE